MESLLKKGKDLEKKYEWLHAIEIYKKTRNTFAKTQEHFRSAEIEAKIGYCYYRAALQAETLSQNRDRLELAIQSYKIAIDSIKKMNNNHNIIKLNQNAAWILYLRSWIEYDYRKKQTLLDEWWDLELKTIKMLKKNGDIQSIAEESGNLLELFASSRFFFPSQNKELTGILEDVIKIGENALTLLTSKKNDLLAKLYCWTSWVYGFAILFSLVENKREEYGKRGLKYSLDALKLSKKTGDAWLIGWSNNAASTISFAYSRNLKLSHNYATDFIKQGKIAKDHLMLGIGVYWKGFQVYNQSISEEDPEKQRFGLKTALESTKKAEKDMIIINFLPARLIARFRLCDILEKLALIETNLDLKKNIFKKIIKISKETLEFTPENYQLSYTTFNSISIGFYRLSEIITNSSRKRQLLLDALKFREKHIDCLSLFFPSRYDYLSFGYRNKAQIQIELSKNENSQKSITYLDAANDSIEQSLEFLETGLSDYSQEWKIIEAGYSYFQVGRTLYNLYSLTNKDNQIKLAIKSFNRAIENYQKTSHYSNLAESYWQKGKIHDQLGEKLESSKNYKLASEAFLKASGKLIRLKNFYIDYFLYMQAWSQIEQARYYHSIEDYEAAKKHYEKAAKLHESVSPWSYLTPNYLAWAKMEEAETLSRKEETQKAKQSFQETIEQFDIAKESFKQKLKEIVAEDEKEMTLRLFNASEFRQKYCNTRILMEEAKLLDRESKYLQSSKKYRKAAQNLFLIIENMNVETDRKELEYLAILCQAWEKMAHAEETSSSEFYLEAAELFEKAKEYCFTKKASLWALGNSSFCKGLASGIEYQSSADLMEHSKAKSLLKSAANSYLQAGFKHASEYVKATQRLLDAYLFMNQAEIEVDQEKRAKNYQMAENLLQIAVSSFMKAKQPEKTTQVQTILANVREEKALAISLNQVMQAPTIATSTISFSAPTSTNEASVGLESFEHANVQANLVSQVKDVKVGESFCLSLEFVNAGREPALLIRVEDFVPSDFVVVKKPEIYRIEETTLNMKGKQIAPLKLVEVKLTLQPSKKGIYQLNPKVHYLDEQGKNRSLQLKTVEFNVEEVVLADRVSTGTIELDSLMLGGIPNEYSVVLTGSPSDEREYIINNFLDAGIREDETVFYISTEADGLESILENPNFILFLCNPKPKIQIPDLPNVFKLRSKTDLTNLSISLAKAYRNIDQSNNKRICIENISDVLVDYGTKATRKWISELITDLGSKSFTILGLMDPNMHPSDQATAVINLFDGEISITQSNDPLDCKKSIIVKKLRNQDYIKNPICLMKV